MRDLCLHTDVEKNVFRVIQDSEVKVKMTFEPA